MLIWTGHPQTKDTHFHARGSPLDCLMTWQRATDTYCQTLTDVKIYLHLEFKVWHHR